MADKTGSVTDRASWSGKVGFILAAAASAVGLGNMWRFPYLAAKYGGGTFLIVYILLVVTLGFSLMIAETALGRITRQSAIGAFKHFGKKFIFIGVLASAVPFIIMPYYSVIGGWVTKYTVGYIVGEGAAMADGSYFSSFITGSGAETFIWMAIFLTASIAIVALGVKGGIEKSSKILMPILIIMGIGIFIFSLTIPGSLNGLAYYLIPDFSKLSVNLVVSAMGQMFFSLSLAMGIMITYGSYFDGKEDLEHSVRRIEIFDTGVAMLAGLMIIPAAVAVTGSADAVAEKAGPGFMFGVLPQLFAEMGPAGDFVGATFFMLVLFAALTSAVSIFETIVSIVQDGARRSRASAIIICSIYTFIFAIICNLGYNAWIGVDPMYSIFGIGEYQNSQILDFMDFLSNTIMMPIVALLTCIFVGYLKRPAKSLKEDERVVAEIPDDVESYPMLDVIVAEVKQSSPFKGEKLFRVMMKWIAPICIILIFIFYILNTIGLVTL